MLAVARLKLDTGLYLDMPNTVYVHEMRVRLVGHLACTGGYIARRTCFTCIIHAIYVLLRAGLVSLLAHPTDGSANLSPEIFHYTMHALKS